MHYQRGFVPMIIRPRQQTLHYRNPVGHYPHVLQRPLVFPDCSGSLPQWKLGEIYVRNPLNLVKEAQNVHKRAYFST